MTAPRYDCRLNGVRYARADPAQAIAGAVLVVALADARSDHPSRQADAISWLMPPGQGARWAALLGADELLADVLAELE